jgi:tetratricopeptide (TPR) repeat protein
MTLLVSIATITGCAGTPRSPYEPLTEAERQSTRADRLCHQAAPIIKTHPDKAEKILREALAADLYHGPSHNNLGVIYLRAGRLYEAAGEFEWAKKLLAGCAEPRLNLALTLERAGHIDEAIDGYRSALEVRPEHLPTLEALTCLELRSGRPSPSTRTRLELIALRGDTQWRDWARVQLGHEEPLH